MGPVVGALWVVGLPAFWPDNELIPLFTSSIGLLILLLYFPGGLIQITYSARDALLRWAESRLPEAPFQDLHRRHQPLPSVVPGTDLSTTALPWL